MLQQLTKEALAIKQNKLLLSHKTTVDMHIYFSANELILFYLIIQPWDISAERCGNLFSFWCNRARQDHFCRFLCCCWWYISFPTNRVQTGQGYRGKTGQTGVVHWRTTPDIFQTRQFSWHHSNSNNISYLFHSSCVEESNFLQSISPSS